MTTATTVRVGYFPGRINEFSVPVGSTVADVLEMAQLNASGYEIKIDGNVGALDSVVSEDTQVILLAEMVKGA